MKFEYLLFNSVVFGCLLLKPLLGLKLPDRLKTYISISIVGGLFIVFDEIVTNYFWSFNQKLILGISLYKLPLEEVLFFVSVPLSCLFLWNNLKGKLKNVSIPKVYRYFALVFFLVLSIISWIKQLYYPSTMCAGLSLLMIVDSALKTDLFLQKRFLFFMMITIFLTLIFNFYLTARPVVLYNNHVKTNLNILTIPVEDFIFGLILVGGTIIAYEYQTNKKT